MGQGMGTASRNSPGCPADQAKWLVFRMIHVKDSLPRGKIWSTWTSWECVASTTKSISPPSSTNMSHEKKPGWLGFIGDYTIQLYGDYNELL